MREGDIFRWSFKEYDSFKTWCTSPYCEYKDGKLLDMYWVGSGDNKVLGIEEINLEFLANWDDLEPIKYGYEDYNSEDIVDLTHRNCMSCYVFKRKGSIKCKETMKQNLINKINEKKKEIDYLTRSVAWDIEELNEMEYS